MAGVTLTAVTQVAPYLDGPAGVHGVLGQAAAAFEELAAMAGLSTRLVPDVRNCDPGTFGEGGVLALFTIGETPWSPDQRQAILEAVRSGRMAVLAVHSASDACASWGQYGGLVGARFDGHPWTARFDVEVADPDHPATAHLPARFTWHDEVYLFKELRPDATVLLRAAPGQLDMSAPGARPCPWRYPLAWSHREGAGRCFYSALGHFPAAWEDPRFLRHLAGGLSWLLEQ